MRRSDSKFIRHQKSVFYDVDHGADIDILKRPPDFYTRMFIEDASLGVMPIGGRSRKKEFKIELTQEPSPVIEDLIVEGLAKSLHSGGEGLVRTVCEFVRRCAAQICANDGATYEIVYLEDPVAKRVAGFEFVFVPEEQLITKGGRAYQVIPLDIAAKQGTQLKVWFESGDLLRIEAPVRFRAGLRKMRDGLLRLGEKPLGGLVFEASQKNIPYDFKLHERSMKLALVEIVRPIGWNARGTFNDCVLSYYWIEKQVEFERFKIELRDTILSGINDALGRAGQKLEFRAQVKVSGLPSVQDAIEARAKLRSGEMAFTDVMDIFKLG